ncbi:MAG: BatD family protein, partial [Myxococcota bacterium]
LVATLGTDVAWVGQVLVYDLRFQTDERVVNGRWSPPDAPGFAVEPSVEPVTAEYTLQQDGKPLSVMELHYPIRASAAGKWTIPAGVLQAQFAVTDTRSRRSPANFIDGIGPFGNVRTEVYSSKPIDVEVRELPTEGRPADATGLVGQFAIEAKASETEVRVGDTVTVEVTVTGDAPLAGFSLPPLAGDGFRVYDDQPVVEARIEDGRYQARATFKRAIVPVAPGNVAVPPIELAYFDPAAEAWARASTAPIELKVGGEASLPNVIAEGGNAAPRGVDATGEDILPIRTDPSLSTPPPRALAAVLLAPGGLALLFQAARSLGRRRKIEEAERPLGFGDPPADPDARLAALERIFRERVAARLG